LSNWFVRRSRKRFWKSENDADKNHAYATLHEVLVKLSQLMAPFTPFVSEEIYKNLTGEESVHLSDFPVFDAGMIDDNLNREMAEVRNLISLGLQARATAKIKVRQPLSKVSIKAPIDNRELQDIIKDELNVKEVIIDKESATEVELDTQISEELRLEGMAREMVRFIQEMRKEAGYEVDNRIKIWHDGLPEVFSAFGELISKETLADGLNEGKSDDFDLEKEFEIEGEKLTIRIKR
ncbi:MAG TPA: isoleucine--tRNA ligase, partial [Candidatus Moranbacteria bacterium]|nr:isoleucine--tRNA ligase [Candidatus Moranbacteria bacterium]